MTTRAFADSARKQADTLFRQGKELMSQQKLAAACAAFQDSNRLEPTISTLLNHANCREKNGQLATAWRLFNEAERQTHFQTDATSQQLNKVAMDRAAKLEARLSKLSIEVPPIHRADGLEIVRGEERIETDAWGHLLPLDGGTYRITAHAPGYVDWYMTVTVKPERDTLAIIIPKLDSIAGVEPVQAQTTTDEASGSAMQNETPTPISTPPQPAAPLQDTAARRSLALPLMTGSAALIVGGVAFAFSRRGDSIYADAEREPNNAKQEVLWQSANRQRHAAIGFAAGAAGCIGAAIYLYMRGGREVAEPVARRSLHIEPSATASTVGLGLNGAW
jgi:hypothetical protein